MLPSPHMRTYQRRVLVIAVAEAVAVGMFWVLLRLYSPGRETHEYPFILLYSLPLGGIVLLCNRPLRRLRRRTWLYVSMGVVSGGVAAVAWAYAALFLTGGYLLAADANPLWCWIVAALAATGVNLRFAQPSDRPGAAPQAE